MQRNLFENYKLCQQHFYSFKNPSAQPYLIPILSVGQRKAILPCFDNNNEKKISYAMMCGIHTMMQF